MNILEITEKVKSSRDNSRLLTLLEDLDRARRITVQHRCGHVCEYILPMLGRNDPGEIEHDFRRRIKAAAQFQAQRDCKSCVTETIAAESERLLQWRSPYYIDSRKMRWADDYVRNMDTLDWGVLVVADNLIRHANARKSLDRDAKSGLHHLNQIVIRSMIGHVHCDPLMFCAAEDAETPFLCFELVGRKKDRAAMTRKIVPKQRADHFLIEEDGRTRIYFCVARSADEDIYEIVKGWRDRLWALRQEKGWRVRIFLQGLPRSARATHSTFRNFARWPKLNDDATINTLANMPSHCASAIRKFCKKLPPPLISDSKLMFELAARLAREANEPIPDFAIIAEWRHTYPDRADTPGMRAIARDHAAYIAETFVPAGERYDETYLKIVQKHVTRKIRKEIYASGTKAKATDRQIAAMLYVFRLDSKRGKETPNTSLVGMCKKLGCPLKGTTGTCRNRINMAKRALIAAGLIAGTGTGWMFGRAKRYESMISAPKTKGQNPAAQV